MREYRICPQCGKGFEANRPDKIYCSDECRVAAGIDRQRERRQEKRGMEPPTELQELGSCVYNYMVSCGARLCDACGWNPEVAKARLAKRNPLR